MKLPFHFQIRGRFKHLTSELFDNFSNFSNSRIFSGNTASFLRMLSLLLLLQINPSEVKIVSLQKNGYTCKGANVRNVFASPGIRGPL